MEIYINDDPFDATECATDTLGDALRRVQAEHCPPGHVIVSVRHNGVAIPGGQMEAALEKPAGEFEKLDLITGAPAQLVEEAMVQAEQVLTESDDARKKTAEHFSAGRIDEAKRSLVDDLQIWQQVHEAITQSIRMLNIERNELVIDGESLDEVLDKPRRLLLQVKEALGGEDYVMLADILKYEFDDVTEPWQRIIEVLRVRASEQEAHIT